MNCWICFLVGSHQSSMGYNASERAETQAWHGTRTRRLGCSRENVPGVRLQCVSWPTIHRLQGSMFEYRPWCYYTGRWIVHWSLVFLERKCENCTILILRGNSYCHRKNSTKNSGFKSLIWRTISRNWHTDTVTHSSTNWSCSCLSQQYQAVDCSSMPITTDVWKSTMWFDTSGIVYIHSFLFLQIVKSWKSRSK